MEQIQKDYPLPEKPDLEKCKAKQQVWYDKRREANDKMATKRSERSRLLGELMKLCAPPLTAEQRKARDAEKAKGQRQGPSALEYYQKMCQNKSEATKEIEAARLSAERAEARYRRLATSFTIRKAADADAQKKELEAELMTRTLTLDEERQLVAKIRSLDEQKLRLPELEQARAESKQFSGALKDAERRNQRAIADRTQADEVHAKVVAVDAEIHALQADADEAKKQAEAIFKQYKADLDKYQKECDVIMEKRREAIRQLREKQRIEGYQKFLVHLREEEKARPGKNSRLIRELEAASTKLSGIKYEAELQATREAAQAAAGKPSVEPVEPLEGYRIIRKEPKRKHGAGFDAPKTRRVDEHAFVFVGAQPEALEEEVEETQETAPSTYLDGRATAALEKVKINAPSAVDEIQPAVDAIAQAVIGLKKTDEEELEKRLAVIDEWEPKVAAGEFPEELQARLRSYPDFRHEIYPPRENNRAGEKQPREGGAVRKNGQERQGGKAANGGKGRNAGGAQAKPKEGSASSAPAAKASE